MKKTILTLTFILLFIGFSFGQVEKSEQNCGDYYEFFSQNRIRKVKWNICQISEDANTVTLQVNVGPLNGGIKTTSKYPFDVIISFNDLNEVVTMRMKDFNKSDIITSKAFKADKKITVYGTNYIWDGEKKAWKNNKTNEYSTLYCFNFKDKIIKN